MSENRKIRVWPWITALLIGLPVLYVVSFGPACWISSRGPVGTSETSARSAKIVCIAYRPMMWICDTSPKFVRSGIAWYSRVGAADAWGWTTANVWANLADNDSIAKD